MVLEADNIELYFDDKRILYGIYLQVETGRITGVLGANGCGKTCLFRILFGDLKPKYSNIRVNGVWQSVPLYASGNTAFLPQEPMTPKELGLSTVFSLFGISWADFLSPFPEFSKYGKIKAGELSLGELRIVETYLILFSGRDIILLDEPFLHISPLNMERFIKLMEARKKNSAILISDHRYRTILSLSDTIYLLKDGYTTVIKDRNHLVLEGYIHPSVE